mgnify:CR=1 FL=1
MALVRVIGPYFELAGYYYGQVKAPASAWKPEQGRACEGRTPAKTSKPAKLRL